MDLKSIRKAERLNINYKPYKKKFDYNINFYIDNERSSPVNSSKKNENADNYLKEFFKSDKYIKIINKLYNNNVLYWANEYSNRTNYFPFRQHYALLAIAITLNNIQLNEIYHKRGNYRNL